MSLNWREIALILSELPLEGSLIQRVHQIGFNALVFELHHSSTGFWQLYVEVGTPKSRIHRLSGPPGLYRKQKTRKLQRFIQFIRAHVEGGRILQVTQPAPDRLILWQVRHAGETVYMVFRFFSGPGANVMVCDDQMIIQELLFRRPKRNEIKGEPIQLPTATGNADDRSFPVRPYPTQDIDFNAYIEQAYRGTENSEEEDLVARVESLRDKQLSALEARLQQARYKVEKSADYESYKTSGDLLSASAHRVVPGETWVTVPDFCSEDDTATATIALDPSLSPGENIANYYRKYQKGKAGWEHALQELNDLEHVLQKTRKYFEQLLEPAEGLDAPDSEKLRHVLAGQERDHQDKRPDPYAQAPGLRFTSSLFTILVGRNAKENDMLLRRWAKGNDWWLHTRDVPGGYVIIKSIAGKSIPLETILDAGNLALLFSKAKEAGKADLYYTQVKHLKRPKGGKQGLVLPTQEKNLTIQLDHERVQRLFATTDSEGAEPWTTSVLQKS